MLDEMRGRPDVDRDLSSQLASAPLDEERSREVAGRISSGFYRDPHILYHVASRVSGALSYEA